MPLTLQNIADRADVLVPNAFSDDNKISWLQEVNNDFFDVVKIPLVYPITSVAGTSDYTLSSDIKSKNIDRVTVGSSRWDSALNGGNQAGKALWTYNETTNTITLTPPPYIAGSGMVRYFQRGKTTFATIATDVPDAPDEYQHLYVYGLCEKISQALDDAVKANNYGAEFRDGLTIAAQNYGVS